MEPFATSNAQHLYEVAKDCLDTHQTLDPSVSSEVGCAEAISSILKLAGVLYLPQGGIPGTATLIGWLEASTQFEEIMTPEASAVIISPSGFGNGKIPGHVGILGIKGVAVPADFGIMSNDSNTGLFREFWILSKWYTYYAGYGGLPVRFFRLK